MKYPNTPGVKIIVDVYKHYIDLCNSPLELNLCYMVYCLAASTETSHMNQCIRMENYYNNHICYQRIKGSIVIVNNQINNHDIYTHIYLIFFWVLLFSTNKRSPIIHRSFHLIVKVRRRDIVTKINSLTKD